MAHLTQGAEAIILRAALRLCPDKIVLLVHDGFVTTEAIDTTTIEDTVCAETGYVMRLAGERYRDASRLRYFQNVICLFIPFIQILTRYMWMVHAR